MKDFIHKNKLTILVVGLVIVGIAVAGFDWYRRNLPDSVIKSLFQIQVQNNQNQDTFAEDGLYVITTGTGAPMPDIKRAGPQTVVYANGQTLVFDTGPGSTSRIEAAHLGIGSVTAVFYTHYHSDHIGDLGELMLKRWATNGADYPLPVYGPTGVKDVLVGFEAAYNLDRIYRIEHHGEDTIPPSGFGGEAFEFDLGTEYSASEVIYEQDGVKVVAFNVNHYPIVPAVGYKVEYKDRSVLITGDTVYDESLVEHAKDVDLLVSEVLHHDFSLALSEATKDLDSNASPVAEDITDYHISPADVGKLATNAGIDRVLATHILPPVRDEFLINPFLRKIRENYSGPVDMANDGTMIFMPVGSADMHLNELIK